MNPLRSLSIRVLRAAIPLLVLVLHDTAGATEWSEGFESTPSGEAARFRVIAGADDGWKVKVTADSAAAGSHCLELAAPTGRLLRSALAVFRQDATPYRGKTVRFAAQMRYRRDAKANGWAQLMIGAARRDRSVVANDLGGDRPVSSTTWTPIAVALFVPPEADTLTVGFSVAGAGSASIDALQLEIVTLDLGRWNRPPAPVHKRGLENLVALARLYGDVRFFHPSDEASAADWDQVVLDAVRRVELAKNATELRDRLQDVFAPLAPTLALGTSALPALDPAALLPPSGSARAFTYWQHDGFGIDQLGRVYSSVR
jgi:hypothetical protein